MRLSLLGVFLTVGLAFAGKEEKFKLINVSQLVEQVGKVDSKPNIFDANNDDTRKKDGAIPGAKLLSSFDEYNVSKELPASKDASLVFYCANTHCMASHAAAERAVDAGYTHVAVMADGIQGWKKAGQKTATP